MNVKHAEDMELIHYEQTEGTIKIIIEILQSQMQKSLIYFTSAGSVLFYSQ